VRLSEQNQILNNYNKRDRLIITYQYHSEVLKVPLVNYYIFNHFFSVMKVIDMNKVALEVCKIFVVVNRIVQEGNII